MNELDQPSQEQEDGLAELLGRLRSIATESPDERKGAGLRIAEDQGHELSRLLNPSSGILPTALLERIPRIKIVTAPALPVAGSAHWDGTSWVVTLNGSQSRRRQRWTLLHELKHVVDHPYREQLYGSLGDAHAFETAERCADLFAACALMPAWAVKQAWASGNRAPSWFASHFSVTTAAAAYRLHQLQLTKTHSTPHVPYVCIDHQGDAA